MMKYSIGLLVCICGCLPLFAQNEDALRWKQLEAENKDLGKKVETLEKKLQKTVEELEAYKEKTKKANVDDLKGQLDRMKADREATIHVNDSLREELGKLNAFKRLYVQKLLIEKRAYLEQPFSAMDTEEITKVIQQCKELGDEAEIARLGADFVAALELKRTFDGYEQRLHQTYNAENIRQARDSIPALMARCNALQKIEVDSVDIRLSRFRIGLECFQDVIRKVDEALKNFRADGDASLVELCIPKVKGIVDNADAKEYERLFVNEVPYLRERYAAYVKAMMTNPLKHLTEVENEILDSKTE